MKKITSLLLAFVLIFSFELPVNAVKATEMADNLQTAMSDETLNSAISSTPIKANSSSTTFDAKQMMIATQQNDVGASDGPMIWDVLPTTEDYAIYEVTIDHSVLPEVVLYACCYGATGDVLIMVTDSDGNKVAGTSLVNRSIDLMGRYWPKNFTIISDSSGSLKTYTVTATTSTGNASFAINFGTKETIVESFGGNLFTTVAKNIPSERVAAINMMADFPGTSALLNTGEWFHYKADGPTYISATMVNHNGLAFIVYDADTGELVDATSAGDRGIRDNTGTSYIGYVSKKVPLENGKDYLILFYTTSHVEEVWDSYYFVSIGYPYHHSEEINLYSSSTYSLPANTTKTFTFTVSGFPSSARGRSGTKVAFTTNSSNNYLITSCTITDPNGVTYSAPFGSHTGFTLDSVDYFSSSNTPINGTWKVQIKSMSALSGLQFKITGFYERILGKPGD